MTSASPPSRAARRARLATIAAFLSCGFTMSAWVVHVPRIMDAVGLDESALGLLLLLMGVASLVSMQFGGAAVARIGSRPVVGIGAVLMVAGVWFASLAHAPWELAASLALTGLGTGTLDLAMNEQAVRVERLYPRPIMGSFHAFFSVGGAAGALLGGVLLSMNLPTWASVGAMVVIGAVVGLGPLRLLLPAEPLHTPAHEPLDPSLPDAAGSASAASSASAGGPASGSVLRLGIILALMAASFFLAEGTVNDWSSRHAVEHLGVSTAVAAAAYGVFSATMTLGRFAADPLSHRFGATAVVRYGAALAAVGIAVVIASPSFPVTVVGWGLYGAGLSGIVPQLFTAAGALVTGPKGAVVLARVVGAGYAGMLAGPAVVGWLAGAVGLNAAFVLPLLLCLLGVALSFALPKVPAQE